MPRDETLAAAHRQLMATTERLLREHEEARARRSSAAENLTARSDEHLQAVLVHLPSWERRDD